MQLFLIFNLIAVSDQACLFKSDFTLTTTTFEKKKTVEVVRGKLYLVEGPVILFETSSPVNQLMRIRHDTTDIYYPEENKLFVLISKGNIPGKNTSISGVLELNIEKELHDAGFRVERPFKKGDTTLLRWQAPDQPGIITGSIGEDLVILRTSGKGWAVELQFRDYRQIGGKRYPLHLRSIVTKPGIKKMEELRLEKPLLDAPLPDGYREDWTKREGVEIKTVEW